MGFIRGVIVTLLSFVLLLSLFLMNMSLMLSWSLEHDTFQPALKSSAKNLLENSFNVNVDDIFGEETEALMQSYCLIESEYTLEYENYTIVVPCEIIQQGEDAVVDYGMGAFIDEIYYDEYDCEFWECLKEDSVPFFLFSEKAMEYWRAKFLLLFLISFVLFILTFLLSSNKPTTVIITGVLIVLSALPLKTLNLILNFIPKEFSGILSVFFTKSNSVFVMVLIIGILFIGIGLAFRFFGWSMNFMKKVSEDSNNEEVSKSEIREIVKEEVSKKMSSKPKRKN